MRRGLVLLAGLSVAPALKMPSSALHLSSEHQKVVARRTDAGLTSSIESKIVCIAKKSGCASGTLVNGCIITAAHVLKGLDRPIKIFRGAHPDVTTTPPMTATQADPHPDYRGVDTPQGEAAYDSDIAVIRPEMLANEEDSFPAKALLEAEKPEKDQLLSIGGYGPDSRRGLSGRGQGLIRLSEVREKTADAEAKSSRGEELSYLTHGDSGGPAFNVSDPNEIRLVGVNTGGGGSQPRENDNASRITFTRPHRKWLKEKMEEFGCGDWEKDPLYTAAKAIRDGNLPAQGSWANPRPAGIDAIEAKLGKWKKIGANERIAFMLETRGTKQKVTLYRGAPGGAPTLLDTFYIDRDLTLTR